MSGVPTRFGFIFPPAGGHASERGVRAGHGSPFRKKMKKTGKIFAEGIYFFAKML